MKEDTKKILIFYWNMSQKHRYFSSSILVISKNLENIMKYKDFIKSFLRHLMKNLWRKRILIYPHYSNLAQKLKDHMKIWITASFVNKGNIFFLLFSVTAISSAPAPIHAQSLYCTHAVRAKTLNSPWSYYSRKSLDAFFLMVFFFFFLFIRKKLTWQIWALPLIAVLSSFSIFG